MDFTQLLASVGGTAVVVAAIAYVLRHSFERLLDSKLKLIEERSKLAAAEDARRQSLLFDKRFDLFRSVATLLYRAKVAAQESLTKQDPADRDRELRRLESYHQAIVELLFQERALLPEHVFQIVHDAKHALRDLLKTLSYRDWEPEADEYPEVRAAKAEPLVRRLEQCYGSLMAAVETSFGGGSLDRPNT